MYAKEHKYRPKHTKLDYVVAGAVSGFVTRTLFQPLDVIKIRFQLQIEPIDKRVKSSKYKGLWHAFQCIIREEGLGALWKGIVPAQFLSISYGALQFVSFEVFSLRAEKMLPRKVLSDAKPVVNFSCGALAGFVATVGSFPFDVTRTRLVAQGEPKVYRNMFHAVSSMMRTEGPLSFYKGLTPTLIQIMPNAGFQFAFYKLFQRLWVFVFNPKSPDSSAIESTCCGAAAGVGAKIAIYPLDLIKKRIQVQGFEEARKTFGALRRYTGVLHCIRTIIKEERILGLYKGLWPSTLKAAATSGSHFLYYEETLKLIMICKENF